MPPGILPRGSWGQQKPPAGTPLLTGEGIAAGIVASWLMNEGGGKIVKDAAGGHDMLWPTANGGPSWRVGRSGPAVSLTDPAALTGLRAANQLTLDSEPLTIAARLAFNQSAGSERAYVARGQDGSGSGWSAALMLSATAKWQFSVVTTSGGAAQFNAIDSATASAEQWYDLVGIFRPGLGPEIYVNGRLVATTSTATTTLRSSTYGFSVLEGKSAVDNGGQAVGYCEYAHVWRRALSPTEVSTLAVAPFCLFAPPVWRRYFIPPAGGGITGTGAITIGAPQLAASGTFTTTGTGAISIGVPVVAGTGSFATTGTGAVSIGAPVIAGTGSFATTGTGSVTITGPVLAATGTFTTTGTGAISIGIPVLAGTGTATGPPGSGDITIATPVLAGAGTFTTTGTGAIAISPPVLAATGSFTTTGTRAISIGGPAVAGSGTVADPGTGSGAITIGPPQVAGAGSFATTGAGAVSISPLVLDGSGTFVGPASGTGAITIPAPVLAGTGTLIYTGTGTITIPGPLLSGYSVLATRAAASDSAYGGAVGSDAAYTGAGAGDLALVGATASDSEV